MEHTVIELDLINLPENRTGSDLALLRIAAMLGSCEQWDSPADFLESIALELNDVGFAHSVSDQDDEALAYWRAIADEQGIGHDGDDDTLLPWSAYS